MEAESEEKDFDKERFVSAKFKDRIKMLGERIPQFLADTPELYPVLSEGVHQWDNATCEKALPILRMAIEIVLAEAAEKKEKARRDREVKVQLQKLHGGNKGAAL
ncbi:hypothetical protein GWL_25730 [Herbaspirillum sp. GW103]|nr:hypothetical protein GWL_25730 [Herbaspirillum sp. GW103]